MAGKYTMTELWAHAVVVMQHDPSSAATKQKVITKQRLVPVSDKTRAPKPQIETPQAGAVLLALLSPDAPTMAATHVYFGWNLPPVSSEENQQALSALVAELKQLGITLPPASDMRFGDILRALLDAAAGGDRSLAGKPQTWIRERDPVVTIWSGSAAASLEIASNPQTPPIVVEFMSLLEQGDRARRGAPRRNARVSADARTLLDFGRLIFASRLRAAELGIQIPVQATLDALCPPENSSSSGSPPPDGSPENENAALPGAAPRQPRKRAADGLTDLRHSTSKRRERQHACRVAGFTSKGSSHNDASHPPSA